MSAEAVSSGDNTLDNLVQVTDTAGNVTTINYDTLGRKINMTDPDMGYWQYTYDANGNLRFQTYAKNQTIEFQYDALGRTTSIKYPDLETVTYIYNTGGVTDRGEERCQVLTCDRPTISGPMPSPRRKRTAINTTTTGT